MNKMCQGLPVVIFLQTSVVLRPTFVDSHVFQVCWHTLFHAMRFSLSFKVDYYKLKNPLCYNAKPIL